ncbi:hypothetical protein [Tomitella cavernea]|nr:hypothetical protein [Tomitella cavernea]
MRQTIETYTLTGTEPVIRGAVDANGSDILVVTGPRDTRHITAGDSDALDAALVAVADADLATDLLAL